MSIVKYFTPPFSNNKLLSKVQENCYGICRRTVPSIAERHRLEEMIGPFGYWEQIQNYQFNFLKGRGLLPENTLLDIGCGPLSGGIALIAYLNAAHYVGIDVSKDAIAEAHIQTAKHGLADKNPYLVVSQSFGRDELGDRTFDYIWASQIMYHLDESTVDSLFAQLSGCTKSGSRFFCDIIGYPNNVRETSSWHEFTFHLHTFDTLETISGKHGFTMKQLGKIESFGYPSTISLKTNEMLEFTKS